MGAHALLAPSSAKRWMTCTPSAVLESTVPEKDTAYTREGTIAHAMAEGILRALIEKDCPTFPEAGEFFKTNGYIIAEFCRTADREGLDWEEMAQTVYENYCRLVYESYLGAKLKDPNAELLIEARLKLSEFIPGGFGSSDAVLIYGDTLEVFDLKYGKGVKVYAEENTQMMCYALGAWAGPGEFYDIRNIRMTIIQPRLKHESSWSLTDTELLHWAHQTLKPAAALAYKGKGELVPGDHCRFCKVAARCKALKEYATALPTDSDPALMTLADVAALLPRFAAVKSWMAAVEDFALDKALEGEKVPGFKIVEGRSVRKISNTSEAIIRLAEAGFDEVSYLKPKELKNITDLEKTLTKKGFTAILGDLVIKPEGKPTLVEEADPRPALSRAAKDFADFIQ